jgi:hypothetical protein
LWQPQYLEVDVGYQFPQRQRRPAVAGPWGYCVLWKFSVPGRLCRAGILLWEKAITGPLKTREVGLVMMFHVLIATNNADQFGALVTGLEKREPAWVFDWAGSVEEIERRVSTGATGILILDEKVQGVSNLQVARKMVVVNPMIHMVLVSALSHADFHEASEGLGILAQLPPNPDQDDAEKLLEAIRKVQALETMSQRSQ